jgi:methyltransferase family protein
MFKELAKRISVVRRIAHHGRELQKRARGFRPSLLYQTKPTSAAFGFDRGLPIGRHYIESFLSEHSGDIRGRVLEVADDTYTKRFGGDKVTKSDVLHAVPGNSAANIVGDLCAPGCLPDNTYDCLILTAVFNHVPDVKSALMNCRSALKCNGVMLASFPGLVPLSTYDAERWGDLWRWTPQGVEHVVTPIFPQADIVPMGNVLIASLFLYGLATHEVSRSELEYRDFRYTTHTMVRAIKS